MRSRSKKRDNLRQLKKGGQAAGREHGSSAAEVMAVAEDEQEARSRNRVEAAGIAE